MANSSVLHRLRLLLLGLVGLGAVGLGLELLLLGHWTEPRQWIPLVLLVLTLILLPVVAWRPGRTSLRLFRTLMVLMALSGIAGALFHVQANAALELEIDAGIRGARLFWSALGGGVPSLAPGAMIQLGLLGILAVLRHPDSRPSHHETPDA